MSDREVLMQWQSLQARAEQWRLHVEFKNDIICIWPYASSASEASAQADHPEHMYKFGTVIAAHAFLTGWYARRKFAGSSQGLLRRGDAKDKENQDG